MATLPEIGSVWREDYDYGAGRVRMVEVVGYADDGRVLIKAAGGNVRSSGRTTKARADRFGRSRGYLPYEGAR